MVRPWPGLLVATVVGCAIPVIAPAAAQQATNERGSAPFAPLPEAPEVDAAKAELGRLLFFDERLAGDTGNSCATCHDPAKGWGDGQALSDGYSGVLYFRNAPGLFNVAARRHLMWDGRLDGSDLATAVRDMITEAHTMNMDTRLAQERLKQVPEYVAMFEAAFGPGDPYGGKIYGAIAEFLKTIRTANAPFDRHLRGEANALAEEQKHGMELFTGKAGCVACHAGPLLSDGRAHVTGVPEHPEIGADPERQITMLRHFATMGTPNYMNMRTDVGEYAVSKDETDIGRFAPLPCGTLARPAPTCIAACSRRSPRWSSSTTRAAARRRTRAPR